MLNLENLDKEFPELSEVQKSSIPTVMSDTLMAFTLNMFGM